MAHLARILDAFGSFVFTSTEQLNDVRAIQRRCETFRLRLEHLLLEIPGEENSQASRTLDEAGVTLREVRRIMAEAPNQQS